MNKMSKLRKVLGSKAVKTVAAPMAMFVVVSGAVLGVSSAAFTGSFTQTGDSWTSGTVALTGDKATAQFSAANIVPDYTESHCITLTSTSNVESALQFYAKQNANTKALGDNLKLTVAVGSGGVDGAKSCTGFVSEQVLFSGTAAALGAANGTAATALNVTKPLTAGGAQQFMITATLPSATPDSVQGGSFNMDFGWINHS